MERKNKIYKYHGKYLMLHIKHFFMLFLRDQDSLTIEIYCSYVQIVSQNYVALQKVQQFCLLQEPHQFLISLLIWKNC